MYYYGLNKNKTKPYEIWIFLLFSLKATPQLILCDIFLSICMRSDQIALKKKKFKIFHVKIFNAAIIHLTHIYCDS